MNKLSTTHNCDIYINCPLNTKNTSSGGLEVSPDQGPSNVKQVHVIPDHEDGKTPPATDCG